MIALSTLPLADAQAIPGGIVAVRKWTGNVGECECPGIARHAKPNAPADCVVFCEADGSKAPTITCFHGSCADEVATANAALRSALGKAAFALSVGKSLTPATAKSPSRDVIRAGRTAPATFDPARLERIARKLDGADAEWFAARSKKQVDSRTPASFLHELYNPGERVVIFDTFKSQGQHLWTHKAPPYNARELDSFRTGKPRGVWFLCNPVSGEYADTGTLNNDGTPHLSRRSWRTVSSWRYVLLESDEANPAHWLCVLAQLPLPIAAIYTSGGRSIHALLRLGAESKVQWDASVCEMEPLLIELGACEGSLSAVRLSRLPCCERLGTEDKHGNYLRYTEPRMQELIYLNGAPDLTPVADLPVIAPGWAEWKPADQDGFNEGREA